MRRSSLWVEAGGRWPGPVGAGPVGAQQALRPRPGPERPASGAEPAGPGAASVCTPVGGERQAWHAPPPRPEAGALAGRERVPRCARLCLILKQPRGRLGPQCRPVGRRLTGYQWELRRANHREGDGAQRCPSGLGRRAGQCQGAEGGREGGGGCGKGPAPAAGVCSASSSEPGWLRAHWALGTSSCADRVPHQAAGDRLLFAPPWAVQGHPPSPPRANIVPPQDPTFQEGAVSWLGLRSRCSHIPKRVLSNPQKESRACQHTAPGGLAPP